MTIQVSNASGQNENKNFTDLDNGGTISMPMWEHIKFSENVAKQQVCMQLPYAQSFRRALLCSNYGYHSLAHLMHNSHTTC